MRKILLPVICILLCSLLCGCERTPEPIELSSGPWPQDTVELSTTVTPEDLALLDAFPALQSVDFSGSECYAEINAWAKAHPDTKVIYTVSLPNGQAVAHDVKSLDLSSMDPSALEACVPFLDYLNSLEEIQLPKDLGLNQLQAVAERCPNAVLNFDVSVSGIKLSPETTSLDLSKADTSAISKLLPWLSVVKNIESIDLGSESDNRTLTWDDIVALQEAAPNAVMSYSFKLYGKDFTLADTEMVLRRIPIDDEGALVKKVTACMPNLKHLDMDWCGVSDEAMAEIRDALPNTNVVWRIWFGTGYTVRTDVERILASNPGIGGELSPENTRSLKYCTKVKYLDLGHNSYLGDISFVSYMPDLEVAVLAMANWSDASPLADCPKLEYLELQTSSLNDLRPLSELKNLKHLNIAHCFALTDLSPIYDLQLERLWIGRLTPIPKEQVEAYQKLVPECKINTTTTDPTEECWRYIGCNEVGVMLLDPRYELLREQLQYGLGRSAYAYLGNDPYYYG